VPQGLNSYRRNASEVNRDVVRWFKRRSNRPFFLFINYFDAHGPYYAPAPYNRRFGEISSKIMSRKEYSHSKHIPYDTKLWKDDRRRIDGSWGSNRVFSFKRVKEIKKDLPLLNLHKSKNLKDFVVAVAQVFVSKKSREITQAQYRSLLEFLT